MNCTHLTGYHVLYHAQWGIIHGEASSSPHSCSFFTIPKTTFSADSTLGAVAVFARTGTADIGSHRRHSPHHSLFPRTHLRHQSITAAAVEYDSVSGEEIDFVKVYCRISGSYLMGGRAVAEPGDAIWLARVPSMYDAENLWIHAWDS